MKKHYLIALLAFVFQFANAQLEPVAYRGAFAPSPAAMWTDSWTNWDPQNEPYTDPTVSSNIVMVSANITTNTTWTTGKTYKLTSTIYVTNNATLTIQPGVIIKGVYSNTGTALVITKGSKINAVGTATAPIVFTSDKAPGSRHSADWGGVILLGKSAFNQTGGINNIEGLAANALTEYGGGTNPDLYDNSGIMKYVRIEFGGFVFSPNNEINGLTFGAVGAGTTIDNIQVSFAGDDSFEWFGGTVNCKHLVAYRGLDDDLDTDNGYAGTVQFALCIRDPQISDNPAISTSEGFESDSNPGDVEPDSTVNGATATKAIFSNCTMVGPTRRLTSSMTLASGYQHSVLLRRRTELKVINSLMLDWTQNWAWLKDASTQMRGAQGKVLLNNNIFAGVSSANLTSYPQGINPTGNVAITTAMNATTSTPFTLPYSFNYSTWMTSHNNTVQASSDGVLIKLYNDDISNYSGSDYRPGTAAATGADFTDALVAPYVTNPLAGTQPVTSPVNLCQGDIATPLNASLTSTGVSLKWYKSTTLTGVKTALITAPTPTTTTAGVQYYWVSQLDASNNESTKAGLLVTINAKPTATFAGIYNTTASANTTTITTFAIAQYVGTTTAFTFSVPALTDSTLSYLWTVPSGVNIVSGGTATDNTITVNFNGVTPNFVGTVGTIGVQAKNATGCAGTAKTFTLTTVLPVAPAAIVVTDKASATPTTAITNYGTYAGSTTPLTATATASATATSYVWTLPAGVNVVTTGTPVITKKIFYAYPFSGNGGVGNTAAGAHKWTVTYNAYTVDVNGIPTVITISTAKQEIIKGNTLNPFLPYGTVITSNTNAILVNFAGITNPSTTALYLGVKAKNGAGESVTSNATNVDVVANSTSIPGLFNTTYTETYIAPVAGCVSPNCGSSQWNATGFAAKTSKLLKMTAAAPAAPATLLLTNPASLTPTTAITDITVYGGTTTPLTLTAAASALASSYEWELPTWLTVVSGSDLTSRSIQVNFAGVPAGTTSLYIGVKAKNFVGSSVTSNTTLSPTTNSTAKLLKLTAALPSVVATVSGQIALICPNSSVTYTITAPKGATSYIITVPVGSIVTSPSNSTNTTNSLTTSDLSFTVNYTNSFATVTLKTIVITSVNFVGNSATNKTLTLTKGTACTARMSKETVSYSVTEIYPNPANEMFNVNFDTEVSSNVIMQIYSINGSLVSERTISLEVGSNNITENVSGYAKGIYFVKFTNSSTNETIVKKLIKE